MEEKELFKHVDEIGQVRLQKIIKRNALASPEKIQDHHTKIKIHPQYIFLAILILITFLAGVIYPGDPGFMSLSERNTAPGRAYLFGTDALGRDVFGMVLHGGRISLLVGLLSTLISTTLALIIGSASSLFPHSLHRMISRLMEIFLSIPSILFMVFIQSVMGGDKVLSISLSIGLSSWMTMAKMVSVRILEVKKEEYVGLARYHGGSFLYLMRRHYLPELIPVVSYMAFSGFAHAMVAEATLSYLGIGFPPDAVTWGSLLNLSGQALLTQSWWVIVIPGIFLVATAASLIETGESLRKKNRIERYL